MFEQKPRLGIDFLVQKGRLEKTPQAISDFLHKYSDKLNKTQIGEYMGSPDQLNMQVLTSYTNSIDFKNIDFSEGIRLFLSGFRLPGESQKIDRMMENFASRYVQCNPSSFNNADAAFILAFR